MMSVDPLESGANLQEGVQCLLEKSLLKLSREQSRSLTTSDEDSTSLPWSSALDVELGFSLFNGILEIKASFRHKISVKKNF